MSQIDYPAIKDELVTFISSRVVESGAYGAVIGLSGGIDSTLTAYLTVEALGQDKVLGLLLPERGVTQEQDIDDAIEITRILGIEHKIIEISPVLRSYSAVLPDFDDTKLSANGNLKARTRMCILYYYANIMNRMVVGTGNKTELLLGYFTKYGDGGVDIEPIGGLYKTRVRELARHMGVPSRIIDKIPTAGLWPGQTDEGELGVSYEAADKILSMLVDEKREIFEVKKVFSPVHVDRLVALMRASEHKRMPPPSPQI
ncbi:NAD+ synthetase [Candidatus Methanoperedens nitroreducens]|uniref:NH(3)-dependent NAD(+) synthetase n=1 Tax=Candidatus Methanoperedens nitratireducens TaxID=1392998 RepID=A0A062V3I3_9EURY|nr:NAD+ synthase [Candidatus Methanoperedens nitroreducens]KCZ70374.1 NAD+ synthetase [Candidatus Methanoperedens nitroreducens]MDJ1420814.1 NAD+ synthase [Candidatus Methanoperedens sp.]